MCVYSFEHISFLEKKKKKESYMTIHNLSEASSLLHGNHSYEPSFTKSVILYTATQSYKNMGVRKTSN